ncbi:MAG: [protein-PII] uridylyltransferase [Actinobacteria bacterium]|nr:[protein-PII] uridylyltransferase [Actinomycetota bacterium]
MSVTPTRSDVSPPPGPRAGARAGARAAGVDEARPGPAPLALADLADVRGTELVVAWTQAVDSWLSELFAEAVAASAAGATGLALVATGGYGRAELCPGSDLDVMLVHAGRGDVGEVAGRLWYPVWDAGLKLGHAVRTVKEAVALASDDLDTATALLDVRLLAGDARLSSDLTVRAAERWQKRGRRWLARLADSVESRHDRAGEVAFLLEPDLKEGRGGLRDVHALRWAERAHQVLLDADLRSLDAAHDALLGVRAELHRRTGRRGDVLVLEEQDGVARALGLSDADELMSRVATAARAIAWRSDESWHRVRSLLAGPAGSRGRPREAAPGVWLRDGEVHLDAGADPSTDPGVALRAAAVAAAGSTRIDRASLDRLAEETAPFPDPWPAGAREALVRLLLAGQPAVAVIEALDQLGVWARVLPEWDGVRCRPQRNAYHRFTVDRHLCEAAANAAHLADRVDRPDLLVVGALLHDIGKGVPGRDHTEVGIELVERIGVRMGFGAGDVAVLGDFVRHHLLLPDVATRRDLGDPATIEAVAAAVGTVETLRLLAALTEADSLATGPAAWGSWKAGLVAALVERVAAALGEDTAGSPEALLFPTPAQRELLAARRRVLHGDGGRLTVVAPDRPGLLSRVAGVLALHGLDVMGLDALGADGFALEVIDVQPSPRPGVVPPEAPRWERVVADLERALEGRLALSARLAARSQAYGRRRRTIHEPPEVVVDNAASASATVVEVHAPDAVGLLHRITRALADLDLDVRSAKVQTLGERVVDAFYVVRANGGSKLTDGDDLKELERALLHAAASQ